MRAFLHRVLLLFVLWIPSLAIASVFDVPANDKSMQYLGEIFGSIGTLPIQANGNPLVSTLIYTFNEIVFALAIVIIIITTIIGTINTAQEGEALGKKMSSVWIPARAGIGMYLLLPAVSGGYNWIQVTVMWLIIQGVGAANALWTQALESNETGGSQVSDTRQADLTNMLTNVTNIFTSVVCMQAINNNMISDPNVNKLMGSDFVTPTATPDNSGVQFARSNPPAGETPLCGTITIPDVGSNPMTNSSDPNDPVIQQRRQTIVDAVLLAEQALEPSAAEALAGGSASTWQFADAWVAAARALGGAAQTLANDLATPGTTTDPYAQAKLDGWIHAGNYYAQLVASGTYSPVSITLGYTGYSATELSNILGSPANAIGYKINNIGTAGGTYRQYVNNDPDLAPFSPSQSQGGSLQAIALQNTSPGAQAAVIMNAIFGGSFFSDAAANFGAQITTGCLSNSSDPNSQLGDPITCMSTFGAKLASASEMTFWIAIVVVIGIWIATSFVSCLQPAAHTMNKLLAIVIPIAAIMLLLVWAAGISLALYVPMIPLLVFTFASITWVLLVIEAMLGAPLIALTLIIPSEDEIGKAGHAIVILLGLFLRPALMILGFIFAQKLLMVAIGMLNFGFAGTMKMSIVGGVGPFGFISILVMYSGIAVSLVHEAFSLIFVLPDKVLRWMGVAGEGSEAGQITKELDAAHEKGAGVGKGIMKGVADKGGKAASSKSSEG